MVKIEISFINSRKKTANVPPANYPMPLPSKASSAPKTMTGDERISAFGMLKS